MFSINAVNKAMAEKTNIVVAMQQDETVDNPVAKDFYAICTEAEIKTVLPLDDEGIKKRVVVIGIRRAQLKTIGLCDEDDKYLHGTIVPQAEVEATLNDKVQSEVAKIYDIVDKYLGYVVLKNKSLPTDSIELSLILDTIAGQLQIDAKSKLSFLREPDPIKRLKRLSKLVVDLGRRAKEEGTASAAGDMEEGEVGRIRNLIKESQMPEDVLKIANQELNRLKSMPSNMSEYTVTLNYLDALATLPWQKATTDLLDIEAAGKSLNEDHYGLTKVKERILEFLAVRKLAPKQEGAILCFNGPPGVGKTSLGESIAKSMGRKFLRMSLGGIHDEAEIRGHRRTYVGAMMGKIMQKIKKIGVNNPVFMLDELDKLCKDFRGDPASALLEVLDPEHNHVFEDNYLNVPFDLSNVFFIGTTNEKAPIPPALRDRMEILDLPGYSPHDKVNIAQDHLVPKQQRKCGLEEYDISVSDNAVNRIVEEYTSEAGVRNLEREIGTVFRKVAVKVASGKEPPSIIKVDALPRLLGPPKSFAEKAVEKPEVGLSAGLAWTQHGGCLLFVEGSLYPGKGEIKLTGNLGKVIQESASAAHTWIKSNAEQLGIDMDLIVKNDIHIHMPSGAVPKDGPSAGIALASCMVSLFVNKGIRNDVAMTGEITLRGRVLPIGGFVEKALAAHRAGMKEVLLPERNKHDIDELPQDIKNEIKVTTVTNLFEALEKLIVDVPTDDTPSSIDPEREGTMINMGT
jgi:ATP-dependent Lon protease